MHHRLAQSLELKLLQLGELIEQSGERSEVHERRRAMGWAILPELDRAHLAPKVALADGLDLEESR
ncbi:MAG: hypothetical protein ACXVCF_00230 [Isosphaeraceae bacterium]